MQAIFNAYQNDKAWPKSTKTHNELYTKLARNGDLFKKFYLNDFNDLQRKYSINDVSDPKEFNSFIKNYWIKLIIELKSLNIYDACNELDITGRGIGGADKFNIIEKKLANETATADALLVTSADLPSSDLVGKYDCKQNLINSYFVYLHIAESGIDQEHKDFVALVTRGQKIIKSVIIPYPPFNNQNEDDVNSDFCNEVYDTFKKCNQFVINEINNNNPNNYTYEFNPPSNENNLKNNIKYLLDRYLYNSAYGEDDYYKGLDYKSPAKQNNDNNDEASFNVELKIQVYYSHINILNKIMQKCQKEKVKYRFDRIASSIKRLLYKRAFTKYAIKNNELLQIFNKVCDTNNTQLVATYYAKKLEDENNQLDENYCAGIIIQFNNMFLTLPSHAYSSFHNIINEYNRKKDELSHRSIFKKVKDTIMNNGGQMINSVISNNMSIADIAANPYVDKNKAIYKYIINNVDGVKEFSSFTEANTFLKKYTSAQYIKLESAFNYLSSNDTQVQEHILQLTLIFTSNNKLYKDVEKIINDNQKYILNINDVKQAMRKIAPLNRLKK